MCILMSNYNQITACRLDNQMEIDTRSAERTRKWRVSEPFAEALNYSRSGKVLPNLSRV